jgi:ABC-type Fe3+ transport system substrate-binding protein
LSDIDLASVATHGGAVLAASGSVAGFMRWLAGKEAQSVATELALLRNDVTALTKLMEKHADLGERVALLERDVKAAHERLDGKRRQR